MTVALIAENLATVADGRYKIKSMGNNPEKILGVEGGGTKTAWSLVERDGQELHILDQGKLPPSNFRLATPDRLHAIFSELPKQIDRAGIFLAGCGTAEDRQSLANLCTEIWPGAKITTGSDRDSGLAAALGHGDGIVLNAGSGSSVTGRRGDKIENAGGWGHILGDAGGGYFLSVQALRLILREYDLHRGEVQFTTKVLQALSLNNLDELVRWAQTADKMEIAMLGPVVFEAAANGDARVLEIIEEGARCLSEYVEVVATRLHLLAPKLGAAWLAAEMNHHATVRTLSDQDKIDDLAAALTEQRNPRSENLEKMSARNLVELFVDEEKFVQEALRGAIVDLARAIEIVAGALRKRGRLFYVGAGSSGRIGVLDASEIPPTFGASPELIQGIIAGGATALYRSVEGAEDEEGAGALALNERRVKDGDIVIGITASGRTPFVLGALAWAKSAGVTTMLLTCNPHASAVNVDVAVDLAVGPEILTGSTRLKAGTATKVALNIISTGAMV